MLSKRTNSLYAPFNSTERSTEQWRTLHRTHRGTVFNQPVYDFHLDKPAGRIRVEITNNSQFRMMKRAIKLVH